MSCVPAPACRALLVQATARWPKRSRASDGICPSAAHTSQNPTSDHELGNAVDLTHDPANGCDAHAWAETLRVRRDRRVSYIISRGQITASYPVAGWPAWAWRPYSGPNPHSTHCHVSIKPESRGDTSPWFVVPARPPPAPVIIPTAIEEDAMFLAWDPNNAWLVFRDPATGGLFRTHVGSISEARATEAALQGGKELVLPEVLKRIATAA